MDNKRLIIILMIFTIIFTIMGGTFAYFNWQSADNRKTNVTFTVNRNYTCGADSGGHIISNDIRLAPAKCNDPVYAIKRPITTSVTTTGDKVVSMNLWLNINSIDTNLTNTSNFKWVLSRNRNNCSSGIIRQGDFRNIQNSKIMLLNAAEYATLDDTYYLYIWLDEAETNSNTMNQSFDFSISGYCEDNGLEKALLKNLNTTDYFREADYKTKITDISFIYDEDLPSGIITNNVKTYDLGASASRPITGYLIENTDQGADPDTYKLYVSSQYKIYAQNLASAFDTMTALKNITFDNFDTSESTNLDNMFRSCSSLTSLDLSGFNTSNVTKMNGTFYNCSGLTSLDVNYFDTSNVTEMGGSGTDGIFGRMYNITELDISGFDTSKVTKMAGMFNTDNSLLSLDLSNFDTSRVTTFSEMFTGTSSLRSLDLSNFDTSNVESMYRMFQYCGVETLDLSNFNTSKVNTMYYMFREMPNLTMLDISSFNTSLVTNMQSMFFVVSKLKTIYVSNLWTTAAVTNGNSMFASCDVLVGGSGTKFSDFGGYLDYTYARIDDPPDNPGFFTYKAYTPPSSGS